MTEDNFTLTTFYTNWKAYQDRISKTLHSLTKEQLELRAAPHLRSVGEIAMHMVNCRAYWFAAFMSDVDGEEMRIYADWHDEAAKQGASVPNGTELAKGLDHSWQFMADHLARWNPTDMQTTFPDEYDGKQVDLSRAWVVWHLLEHDLHHGGEISHTLGMHDIPVDFPG